MVSLKRGKNRTPATAAPVPSPSATPTAPDSSKAPRPAPETTRNAAGLEVAGPGPETTESFQKQVREALQTLDPKVARWWNSNSVKGVVVSRAVGVAGSAVRSSVTKNNQPVIEVDKDLTAGQTAQAITSEITNSWFADSIGTYYKNHRFAQSEDVEEFRKWQQGATKEAAHLASVLAEMYATSIAKLTPAGDLIVTLGDVAENGPRWNHLVSILPFIGHLPIGSVVLKFGKLQAKIPKKVERLLDKLTNAERKMVLVAAAGAKTDDEAASIIVREVAKHVDDRQIDHAISETVHKSLEKHPLLRGKYRARDRRFETLAVDLEAHNGYDGWHRDLDKEVATWVNEHKNATETTFEAWLRERYAKPDLKARFPAGF